MKEQIERTNAVGHEAVQPAAPVQQGPQTGEAPWAASPETAIAKESVRRDAQALPAEQVDALAAEINVKTPSEQLAASGELGAEIIDEVAQKESEQQIKRRAIGDAYGVVMAGSAAAGGQVKAQSAIDAAGPEVRQAATTIAKEPAGGTPLPDGVREKMEQRFGEDFKGVQIHTSSSDVGALGAGAAAKGEHIHFASGKFDPTSEQGEKLIAHELTHVVQARGASKSAKQKVAASASPAEQEAEAVAAGDGPASVKRGTAEAEVHLGEAGVHRGIELDAAGVGKDFDPKKLTPQQRAALEMYSGNFMRDYSQLAAPMPLKILSSLPSTNKDGKIGNAGARSLMDAIVQAIAILELGKDIGKGLVTQKNTGVYEAEQHLDNPMGTSGANDFITDGANPRLAASPQAKAIATFDARGAAVTAPNSSADADTAKTHAGSAAPGLQYENPELYKVGDGGLANHLANSTESSKDCFLAAVEAGATPTGRMKAGMGQHVVEDYFSHSNFIEVGLNSYINDALRSRQAGKAKGGQFVDQFGDAKGNVKEGAALGPAEQRGVHAEFSFVDTLYDQKTKTGKQAVTTGSFGGTDSQVSLGHVLLPKLPVIENALHKGIDSTFGIVDQQAKTKQKPTWQLIRTMLDQRGNEGAATGIMLEASKSIGLAVPCPSGFHITTRDINIPLWGKQAIPNGVALDYTNVAIADALVTGGSTYVDVMEKLESMKKAAGIIGLQDVITKIQDTIKLAMQKMFAAIKAKTSELIRSMIIDMYQIDPKKAANASVDELTQVAERQMHEKTERTSLESRMQGGGDLADLTRKKEGKAELERRVGPVRAKYENMPQQTWGTPENPWVTVNALPPSHSEISKDHPPHKDEKAKPEWHEQSEDRTKVRTAVEKKLDEQADPKDRDEKHESLADGSGFYGLHRALAVEADRHIQKQLATCWRSQVIPGQDADDGKLQVGHDKMLGEAKQAAGWAAEQRARGGFRHAQTDTRVSADLRGRPEVMQLLDLVDMFVSHPASSTWWRTIFDNYLAQNGEEVYKAILARNLTRGRRKPA